MTIAGPTCCGKTTPGEYFDSAGHRPGDYHTFFKLSSRTIAPVTNLFVSGFKAMGPRRAAYTVVVEDDRGNNHNTHDMYVLYRLDE